ncbi:MAG: hypothetical protein F2793_06410 [Actinobacteria bacterium]|nr:hypothetical protein [Actinomycetota bacterium]
MPRDAVTLTAVATGLAEGDVLAVTLTAGVGADGAVDGVATGGVATGCTVAQAPSGSARTPQQSRAGAECHFTRA